jgi:hypothetical protein
MHETPTVKSFGGGGHLSMPFWSGRRSHAGMMGEILIYDRALTEEEVRGVESSLGEKYGLEIRKYWEIRL